jgi:hypothetical protein
VTRTYRLILTLAVLTWPRAGLAADWEKISDDEGITVYQKKDGDQGTGVSLRGETVIPARLDDILDTMKDNTRAHLWIPMVKTRRDLKQVSPNERIEYTHISMPWPITDRYFINKAKAERLPSGQMRIFVQSVDQVEESWIEKDKILGFLHYSEFMLTPVGTGERTHMVIEINSDPRGLIPKFLVNAAQKSWPRKFFTGLNRMLQEASLLQNPAVAH